jgi:hypothetical protein
MQYIVFLDQAPGQAGVEQRAAALLRSLGLTTGPTEVFAALNGFVVDLPNPAQANRLRALGGVQSVEADAAVMLAPPIAAEPASEPASPQALQQYGNSTATTGEVMPYGVTAMWQGNDIASKGNVGAGTYAFVIDSGILTTTGDLNVDTVWARSWVTGESPTQDGNGHGTHVAGTIAALANGLGVVGVAPGATVVPMKVFDSNGGGASYSTIISAINACLEIINQNNLDKSKVVINMSLGGPASSSLETAVRNAASQNVRFAIAAGNSGADADGYSPANAGDAANVYTVTAVNSRYAMASWSNWDVASGTDVDDTDVAAPGVSVLSYYQGGGLAYLSGTSMAAPHVAGALLMGGVIQGDLVTPVVGGSADPFAWVNSMLFGGGGGEQPPANNAPAGTDTTITIDQGGFHAFSAADFGFSDVDGNALAAVLISTTPAAGSLTLNGAAVAAGTSIAAGALGGLRFTPVAGASGNGYASLTFQVQDNGGTANGGVDTDPTPNTVAFNVVPAPVTGDLILWGSTANDVVRGGLGNDQIAGVPATGSTAASLGRGQVDVLIGDAGADRFLLADNRGVFYNDGRSRNKGMSDYGFIKDFSQQQGDQLVLQSGRQYLMTNVTVNGVPQTEIYLGNGDQRFNSSDELIGVLDNTALAPGSGVWILSADAGLASSWITMV